MKHQCPGPGCEQQINWQLLACRRHWYQVSPDTRNRVYAAWDNGNGAGSDAHTQAIQQAVSEMKP